MCENAEADGRHGIVDAAALERIAVGMSVFSVAQQADDDVIGWNAQGGEQGRVFKVREPVEKNGAIALRATERQIVCTGGVEGFLALAGCAAFERHVKRLLSWAWVHMRH